ncbi:hypothetical protein [Maricaulis maris]|uniref:hypothetical protein n=1 Tax=Maricaulis maris TaxID=74318 RepID=UPI003A8D9406
MAGFEIYNDAGYKIAGNDYPNLVLYGKGQLTTTDFNINGPGFDGRSYIGSAVVPDDGGTVRFYRSISGHHMVEQGGRIFSESRGALFEYYSFGPVVADESSGGFELYREDGQLMFCTSRPFLRLAGVYVDTRKPDNPEVMNQSGYAFTAKTAFAQGTRKFAFQFSNAHLQYRLYRFADRPYSVSYEYVRAAALMADGTFKCRYLNRYNWTHSIERRRVWEVANGDAPQRMLIADVTGL